MTTQPLCPSCTTSAGKPKTSYATVGDAATVMAKLAKAVGSHRLNVYPCPKGHGWHVGHKPGTLNDDLKRIRRHQAAVRATLRSSRRRKRR